MYYNYSKNLKSKQDLEEEYRKMKCEKHIEGDLENLNLKLIKNCWTMNEYLNLVKKCTITIKYQNYSKCESTNLDNLSAYQFSNYVKEMNFENQRMGYLYGYTKKGKTADHVFVNYIYEPPQKNFKNKCIEEKDDFEENLNSLSNLFKMKKVGWIISFKEMDKRQAPLNGNEILKACEFQSKYGQSFVTIVVYRNYYYIWNIY